jgi:hypothetical protein
MPTIGFQALVRYAGSYLVVRQESILTGKGVLPKVLQLVCADWSSYDDREAWHRKSLNLDVWPTCNSLPSHSHQGLLLSSNSKPKAERTYNRPRPRHSSLPSFIYNLPRCTSSRPRILVFNFLPVVKAKKNKSSRAFFQPIVKP